jgi:hypothetical protein
VASAYAVPDDAIEHDDVATPRRSPRRQVLRTGADPTTPRLAATETGLRSVTDAIERIDAYRGERC